MTVETAVVGAGWYKDPGGSSALRWWDGTGWTEHLHQPAPPAVQPQVQPQPQAVPVQPMQPQFTAAPPQVAQQPDVHLSSYSPTTGFSGGPRNQSLVPGYLREDPSTAGHYGSAQSRVAPVAAPPSNGVAWAALGLGAFSLAAMIFHEAVPAGNYYLPIFGISSIIMSIRAFWRYRQRRVTVLWAPILGLVFGVAAEVLLLANIAVNVFGVGTQSLDRPVGTSNSATAYDMGNGSIQYYPANNPGISADAAALSSIVGMMHTAYPSGVYPTGLSLNGTQVTASDGTVVGSLSLPMFQLGYYPRSDGSFALFIGEPNTNESTMYSSSSDEYFVVCTPSDTSCATNSPKPSITVTGNASGTTTTTTTTNNSTS